MFSFYQWNVKFFIYFKTRISIIPDKAHEHLFDVSSKLFFKKRF